MKTTMKYLIKILRILPVCLLNFIEAMEIMAKLLILETSCLCNMHTRRAGIWAHVLQIEWLL